MTFTIVWWIIPTLLITSVWIWIVLWPISRSKKGVRDIDGSVAGMFHVALAAILTLAIIVVTMSWRLAIT